MAHSTALSPSAPDLCAPPPQNPADEIDDESLLLNRDHCQRVRQFRNEIRLCKTDREKYDLCVQVRNELLEEHNGVQLLAAACEQIMLAQCIEYTDRKKARTKRGSHGEDKAAWDRFLGVAKDGLEIKSKCLTALKTVAHFWGQETVQHYGWAYKGRKYCDKLCAAAREVHEWKKAVTVLNWFMIERSQRGMSLKRRPVQASVNPIEQGDLENLRKNPPREALAISLPDGFGFDKFGLMVQKEYAVVLPNTAEPSLPTNSVGITELPRSSSSVDIAAPASHNTARRLGIPISAILCSSQADSTMGPGNNHSGARPPGTGAGGTDTVSLSETSAGQEVIRRDSEEANADDDDTNSTEPDATASPSSTTPTDISSAEDAPLTRSTARERSRKNFNNVGNGNNTDRGAADDLPGTLGRQLRKRKQISCPETPSRGNNPTPPRQHLPLNTETLVRKRCCPEVPDTLLRLLDHPSEFRPECAKRLDTRKLCFSHLRAFSAVLLAAALERDAMEATVQKPDPNTEPKTVLRRRSFSDISLSEPLQKRQRFCEHQSFTIPSAAGHGHGSPPVHHRDRDDAYRRQVLGELEARLGPELPECHGRETRKLIHEILSKSQQPNTDPDCGAIEALFCSGEEAAAEVESGTVQIPIITEDQQRFSWKQTDRPISQLFQRMENLRRPVSVQIPSRPSTHRSFESRKLLDVQKRFLDRKDTDDPWNILDLRNPLPPSILPFFLEGENCQLLPRMRDAVLMADSAERPVASGAAWNEWRDILEWVLLSEGGHHTAPHTDSHGLATWLTVQEGFFGFGWMSRPTQEDRDEWMANPTCFTGGQWRYVVLRPGQTIFFNSGMIHFVFRARSGQTLALGGHVLQWSGIEQWLRVVIDQMKNPHTTNEDMAWSAPMYIRVVADLVKSRVKCGRVAELGGRATVDGFLALLKEFESAKKPRKRPSDAAKSAPIDGAISRGTRRRRH